MRLVFAVFLLVAIPFALQAQTTVQNGAWSDPATWDTLPTGAEFEVATVNHTVTIDAITTAVVYKLVNNGSITQHGRLEWWGIENNGTLIQNPGHTMHVRDFDGDVVEHGLINYGYWEATGTPKECYVHVTHDIPAGATVLTLDKQPKGWQVGDKLFLPDTRQQTTNGVPLEVDLQIAPLTVLNTNEEFVTIVSIVGNVVTITPTANAHNGSPDNPWGLEYYPLIVNTTRNSVWTVENPQNPGHTRSEVRGEQRIRHVKIIGFGGTRGDLPLHTTNNNNGNIIGRYPMHFHKTAGPLGPYFGPWQGEILGCVILNPPENNRSMKWGIAVHESDYNLIKWNFVYRANGGIVTESGNEVRNVFTENCVANSQIGHQVRTAGVFDQGSQVDIAHEGSGFWLRSTGNDVNRNEAYSCGNNAFVWTGYLIDFPGLQEGFRYYRTGRGSDQFFVARWSDYIETISGNRAWSTWVGMYMSYPTVFPGPAVQHPRRTMQNGITAINCWKFGSRTYHDGNMDFVDQTYLFDEDVTNTNVVNGVSLSRPVLGWGTNVTYEANGNEWYNLRISGAVLGMQGPRRTNGFFDGADDPGPCILHSGEFATRYGIGFQYPKEGSSPAAGDGEVEFTVVDLQMLANGVTSENSNWSLWMGGPMKYFSDHWPQFPPSDLSSMTWESEIILPEGTLYSLLDPDPPAGAVQVPTVDYPDIYGLLLEH